jgi:hypothetical protein
MPMWLILTLSVGVIIFSCAHLYLQMLGIKRDPETGEIVHSNQTAIVMCTFWGIVFLCMYFFGFFKVFAILFLISLIIEGIRLFIKTI